MMGSESDPSRQVPAEPSSGNRTLSAVLLRSERSERLEAHSTRGFLRLLVIRENNHGPWNFINKYIFIASLLYQKAAESYAQFILNPDCNSKVWEFMIPF